MELNTLSVPQLWNTNHIQVLFEFLSSHLYAVFPFPVCWSLSLLWLWDFTKQIHKGIYSDSYLFTYFWRNCKPKSWWQQFVKEKRDCGLQYLLTGVSISDVFISRLAGGFGAGRRIGSCSHIRRWKWYLKQEWEKWEDVRTEDGKEEEEQEEEETKY